jgi:predicted secreted hydrolase
LRDAVPASPGSLSFQQAARPVLARSLARRRCARGGIDALSLLLVMLLLAGCRQVADSTVNDNARDPVTGMLQGDTAGFAVADRVRPFVFPRDHGPHRAFRTEWWYFTGHLEAADGRRFGFQYTVFRQAIAPPSGARDEPAVTGANGDVRSAWRTDTAWLAHMAVTDMSVNEMAGDAHVGVARIARDALGLGGARMTPDGRLALDVDGWRLRRAADGEFSIAAEGTGEPGLRLRLRPVSEPLLQGEQGLSRKGPASASYYFSIPRLEVVGELRNAGGEWIAVRGGAWLDREWSTSALAPEQVGWDWFSLSLDDGSDLMLFRLRRRDGTPDPFDAGTLRRAGVTTSLRAGDFSVQPLAWWEDERGRRWPVRWVVQVARPAVRLEVEAVVQDQLMRVGLEYWEGAVDVRGDVRGRGYLEMTGYPPSR